MKDIGSYAGIPAPSAMGDSTFSYDHSPDKPASVRKYGASNIAQKNRQAGKPRLPELYYVMMILTELLMLRSVVHLQS
jgi:hypothetical protein